MQQDQGVVSRWKATQGQARVPSAPWKRGPPWRKSTGPLVPRVLCHFDPAPAACTLRMPAFSRD